MPKKNPLPTATDEQRRRAQRVRRHHRDVVAALDRARQARGVTQRRLAEALGPDPRYVSRMFRGRAELPLHRLFLCLDVLGLAPAELFAAAFPGDGVPGAAVGHLPRRARGHDDFDPPSFCARLLAWGGELLVTPDGDDFPADVERFRRRRRTDPEAARFVAAGWLQAAAALGAEALSPPAAERLCSVLGGFAHLLAAEGQLRTAADLLDLALRVEAQLRHPPLRARLYRQGAELLDVLDQPLDAEAFADRAARLDQVAGDLDGLRRSTYLQAAMLERLGRLEPARELFAACVAFQDEAAALVLDSGEAVDPAARLAAVEQRLASEPARPRLAPLPPCQVPDATEAQRRRARRVRATLGELYAALDHARAWSHHWRYHRLDRALGREPGYLASVFHGTASLNLERLLAAVDVLGFEPGDFFAYAFPESRLPPAPLGFSKRRRRCRPRPSSLPLRGELCRWLPTVEVTADGAGFATAAPAVVELLDDRAELALRRCLEWLRGVVEQAPSRLSPSSAEALCRVLDPLAYLLRLRGDLDTAAELAEQTFLLESKLRRPRLRSLLYRTSTYLLNDLGRPEEALTFANRAVRLAWRAGDVSGLGRSRYLQGVMLHYLGCFESSNRCFRSLLVPPAPASLRARIHTNIAINCQELRQLDSASRALDRSRLLDPTPVVLLDHAWRLAAEAKQASLEERALETVDRLFERAANQLALTGSAPNVALFELERLAHLFRYGQLSRAALQARALMELADEMAHHPAGEAALLDVLQRAVTGELLPEHLLSAIERLRRFRSTT